MKKIIIFYVLLAAVSASLAADISLGFTGGYTYAPDPDSQDKIDDGYTVDQSDFPLMGEIAYTFDPFGLLPALGSLSLSIGVRGGYANPLSYTAPESLDTYTNIDVKTLPVYAFARLTAGYLFADMGAGVHFWDCTYKTDIADQSGKGTDFSYMTSLGGIFNLLDRFSFWLGPTMYYFYISNIGNGNSANLIAVGATAGFAVRF